MTDPGNIVLDHLRAIRSELARVSDRMTTMSAEITAIRQHLSGLVTLQDHDHGDIASIKSRLDRIEKRLDLVD